jgi:hypothetical protein
MSGIEITLPVSGHKVRINRLRNELIMQARASAEEKLRDKKPKPPMQSIPIANGGFEEVENLAHPEYVAQLEKWNLAVGSFASVKVAELMAHAGLAEDPPESINDTMQTYKRIGISVSDDKRIFWMMQVLAPTDDDFKFLMFEIFGRSLAREEQVAFWRNMFPSHTPGPIDMANLNA